MRENCGRSPEWIESVTFWKQYSSAPLDRKGYQSAFLIDHQYFIIFFTVSLTSYYSNLLFCRFSITGHFYGVVCVIPHINSSCSVLLSSLCHYYTGNCYTIMPPLFFLLAYLMFVWLLLHCNIMVRFALRQNNLQKIKAIHLDFFSFLGGDFISK